MRSSASQAACLVLLQCYVRRCSEALLERERQHVERLIAEEKADPTREAIYSPSAQRLDRLATSLPPHSLTRACVWSWLLVTHLWVKGDEELPPLLAGKIGLVLSNLSLHWVNDLPACLQRIQESLLPDGALIASMFAEDTLIELRESFAMAEQERDGGVSPHVSPFVGVADVGNLLMGAQFALPTGTRVYRLPHDIPSHMSATSDLDPDDDDDGCGQSIPRSSPFATARRSSSCTIWVTWAKATPSRLVGFTYRARPCWRPRPTTSTHSPILHSRTRYPPPSRYAQQRESG